MNETKARSERSLFSDGLVIAIITAYVYLATFAYEYGFCSYFGIPISLIAPNLSTMLAAAVALGGVLATLLTALAYTGPILSIFKVPARGAERAIWGYLGAVFLLLALGNAIYSFTWKQLTVLGLSFLAFGLVLLLPAFLFDRKKPFSERLDRYLGQSVSPESLESAIFSRIDRKFALACCAGAISLLVASLIGDGEARRKVDFLTVVGDADTVVLRNYGELMIGSKLSRPERQVSRELRLIWLGEKKRTDFLVETVGPLKLGSGPVKAASTLTLPRAPAKESP